MPRTPLAAAIASLVIATSACIPEGVTNARRAAESGDLPTAAELYASALADSADEALTAEARPILTRFVASVVDAPDREPPSTAEFELAIRCAEQLGHKSATASLWRKRAILAEKAGDLATAITGLRKGYPDTAAKEREEAVARLIQRHTKYEAAAAELRHGLEAFPGSVVICIANAFWMSDKARFDEALAEYDRCSGIEGQTMEQALYIGAQRATIKAYAKKLAPKKGRKGKGGKRG